MAHNVAVSLITLSSILSVVPVESPALPGTSSDLPYVTSEEENESCFYEEGKPIAGGLKLRCEPGYYAQSGRSYTPCSLCPHNENIQTYQPKKSFCEKCILCRNCSALGMEVAVNCTLTTNTVCKPINSTDRATTTDAADLYITSSPPPIDVATSAIPTKRNNLTDCPACSPCSPQIEQNHHLGMVIVLIALLLTVGLSLPLVIYKRWTYKLRIGQLEAKIENLERRLSARQCSAATQNGSQSEDTNGDGSNTMMEDGPTSADPLLSQNGAPSVDLPTNETTV